MPNTIVSVKTEDGTVISDGGSTDKEALVVTVESNENQYIQIVDTPTGDRLGLSLEPVNGSSSIGIKVAKGRAYKIVAKNRNDDASSNVWSFRVTS